MQRLHVVIEADEDRRRRPKPQAAALLLEDALRDGVGERQEEERREERQERQREHIGDDPAPQLAPAAPRAGQQRERTWPWPRHVHRDGRRLRLHGRHPRVWADMSGAGSAAGAAPPLLTREEERGLGEWGHPALAAGDVDAVALHILNDLALQFVERGDDRRLVRHRRIYII